MNSVAIYWRASVSLISCIVKMFGWLRADAAHASCSNRRRRSRSCVKFLLSSRSQDSACLILDLQLPGMSGLELQSQLHVSNPGVPIVFISAHGDEQARAKTLTAGAVEFLQKPFSEEALFEAIKTSLSSRGSSVSAYFDHSR